MSKLNKFKKGDKVIVKKPHEYFNVNDVGIILEDGRIEVIEGMHVGCKFYGLGVDVEKFLEPKYKVGDIVYCYPSSRKPGYMEDTCEIVKFALNKKKSAYSYLAFNDNGYIFCFQEDEVLLVGKCRNCGAKI